uniref:Unconventional prefoldin RPB5 interactor n=1 Tax=Phallusia mammillata TaxID=59560 RepID=A0A6F9D8Q4_9ASCI|nr:unconventional prefoldin RPB5 interactor [Phallusia mammillata]
MVDRLNAANAQAQNEVKHQIHHWRKVENDYKTLSDRLKTLPDKMTHKIMVPFGPLAFIPGQLVHTNELLVHLGDSWFADVTCSQGQKIINHRMQAINKNIEDLGKTLSNLEKKTEFSHEVLSDGKQGSQNVVEIKEKVPADYLHPSRRKRVSRVKEGEQRNVKTTVVTETPKLLERRNEDLMKRLEELEKLEGDETDFKTTTVSKSTKDKNVSWSEEISSGTPLNIRFKHSPVSDQCNSNEMTPGDIGKSQQNNKESSISATEAKNTPLSQVVVEHKPSWIAKQSNTRDKPRKMSKFKSDRTR